MSIQDTMVNLLLKQPFYGYIAASITPVENNNIPTVEMIIDPSLKLLFNRKWYEKLKNEEGVGVVIHELLHLILMHTFRKGNRERQLWVIACDMAVNEHIDKNLLLDESVTVERISKEIREEIPKQKSAEFYYDIISSTDNRVSFIEKDKEIRVVLRDGGELKANNSPPADSSEVNKNAFKSMLADLIEQAKEEGDMPDGISGVIRDAYGTQEVNWRNVLKKFLTGRGRILFRKTYKRESKRYEGLPGSKRTLGVSALLALDESGSISDSQSGQFYREMLNIKKITSADLIVTEFDTSCSEPVPIDKYIRAKKRVKNGGTDFRPVFKLAEKLCIPLVIIFTDGDGTVPKSCEQKVLWVLTKGGKKPCEFGYSIDYKA